MYETYVEDKFELDIKELFRESDNLWAYQNILARMIEVTRKDYWNPDAEVLENLTEEFIKTVEEVGLACSGNICDNQKLTDLVINRLEDIPGSEEKVGRYEGE